MVAIFGNHFEIYDIIIKNDLRGKIWYTKME